MPLEPTNTNAFSLALSSTGHLYLDADIERAEFMPLKGVEQIREFFSLGDSIALLRLGLTQFDFILPTSFSFWQQFSKIFITEVCKHSAEIVFTSETRVIFPTDEMQQFLLEAPFIRGIQYFDLDMAKLLWQRLLDALMQELIAFKGNLEHYFSVFHLAWNTVGRVCFHLAENKNNEEYPFAFLATYTTGLSKEAKTQHLPLGQALEATAGKGQKERLLALLLPVHKACEKSSFLKELLETNKIFKPQAWTAKQAYAFLKDASEFESAGVMIRVPNWWHKTKPPKASIQVTVGNKPASELGLKALLDFEIQFALPNGETLNEKEFRLLLNSAEELVQVKGQWVQVDSEKLNQVLLHWKSIEKQVKIEGLSFSEGLRLLSGAPSLGHKEKLPEDTVEWSTVLEGDWLRQTLTQLRQPSGQNDATVSNCLKAHLKATLRPYQERGVQWLWYLYHLHLGGCLADDMGLGKTVQIISLLLLIKHKKLTQQPHLLVLPASLLGNWQAELNRFAPDVSFCIAHSSNRRAAVAPALEYIDLVITTYGTLHRLPWLTEVSWDLVILDEAQAIKNPTTQQTRTSKSLKSNVRFVLTGTPIENKLLDLWSLFDFVAPGLLGTSRVFAEYGKQKAMQEDGRAKGSFYAAIRRLLSPYILRRLKSDKRIISDLPDKTELQTYCILTPQQITLYQQAVTELGDKLKQPLADVNRRGLVMSYLLRFKQICNHPCQWLGHGVYSEELSGKFLRLKELCAVVVEKQEKILIFTQFKEIIPALFAFLTTVFKREGLYLHGQTPIKERAKLVESFQTEQGPPFFILSLKAGGTGLNLTAASHVVHFDRWWNPAVENQATDRAFRIGQKKNVLVHKFICQGTIEEKIDLLLESKKTLSDEIIGAGKELSITQLSNDDLMQMITLDIHRVLMDNE